MNGGVLVALALAAGTLIPLQTALNAQLGRAAGHPVLTTLLVFTVGVLASAALLAVVRPAWPDIATLRGVPSYAWLGGLLGTLYIVLLVFLAPRLGVGLTTALVLGGQLAMALAIDHVGAFGTATHPLNLARLAGLLLMAGGIALIKAY